MILPKSLKVAKDVDRTSLSGFGSMRLCSIGIQRRAVRLYTQRATKTNCIICVNVHLSDAKVVSLGSMKTKETVTVMPSIRQNLVPG